MAAADAHPYPIYGCKYRLIVPLLNDAGQLVTGGTGLTAQIAVGAGNMGPATNAPLEIPVSSGLYTLDLTQAEMFVASIAGVVKSTTAGARPTPFVLSLRQLAGITAGTMQAADALSITLAASEPGTDRYFNGCFAQIYANPANPAAVGQARSVSSYSGAERKCHLTQPWEIVPGAGCVYVILQSEGAYVLSHDPLTNPSPGSYAAGTAGQAIGSMNGRLPAALVGGRMDAAADVQTWRGAQPSPLSGSLVPVWIAAGAMASGAITANAIATGALTNQKFAADSLTANALAADAVAEIQAGLSTLDAAGVRAAVGMAAADLDVQLDTINTNVITGYGDLQSRLPAALSGGRMRSAVEAMGVGTITAEAFADSAVDEITGAVWDENLGAHLNPDSTGEALAAAAIGGGGGDDPWATFLPGSYPAGSAGEMLGTRLDVAVSTRLATADYVLPPTVAAIQAGLATAAALAGVQTDVDLLQADVDNLQTRLPAALVGGRMPADISGQQSGLTPDAVDAILDEVIEGPFTLRQILRVLFGSQAGKTNGALGPQFNIRDVMDTKNRVQATIDEDGNRLAVAIDGS